MHLGANTNQNAPPDFAEEAVILIIPWQLSLLLLRLY